MIFPPMLPFIKARKQLTKKKEFETGQMDCAVFTSASTVRGFVKATPGLDYTKVRAACILVKQTKAEADAVGMETYMAKKATIDSVLYLVIELKEKNSHRAGGNSDMDTTSGHGV